MSQPFSVASCPLSLMHRNWQCLGMTTGNAWVFAAQVRPRIWPEGLSTHASTEGVRLYFPKGGNMHTGLSGQGLVRRLRDEGEYCMPAVLGVRVPPPE